MPCLMSKAASYLLLATVFFTGLNVCVKFLPHIPTPQLVFFRGLVTLVACFAALKQMTSWGANRRLLLLRGFFGNFLLGLFYCLPPDADGNGDDVFQHGPAFHRAHRPFLAGRKGRSVPGFISADRFCRRYFSERLGPFSDLGLAGVGVAGAFMAACAYTCVRMLRITDHPMVVIFYFPLISSPLMIGPTVYQWVSPSAIDWAVILLLSILTQLGQNHMTKAYQMEKAATVMIYNYAGIFWAVLIGWFVFHESLALPQFIGLGVIVLSLVASSLVARHSAAH